MSNLSRGMKVIVPSGSRSDKGAPVRGTVLHDDAGKGKEWWIKLDEPQSFGDHGWYHESEVEAIVGEAEIA